MAWKRPCPRVYCGMARRCRRTLTKTGAPRTPRRGGRSLLRHDLKELRLVEAGQRRLAGAPDKAGQRDMPGGRPAGGKSELEKSVLENPAVFHLRGKQAEPIQGMEHVLPAEAGEDRVDGRVLDFSHGGQSAGRARSPRN